MSEATETNTAESVEDLWSKAPLAKQVARMMAEDNDSGVDWDAWADDIKEGR